MKWFQNGKLRSLQAACPKRHFHPLWKTSPDPRTKPVIARDTTYGISLLTATISGSKFAIPDSEFHLTGMGRNPQTEVSSQKETRTAPSQR